MVYSVRTLLENLGDSDPLEFVADPENTISGLNQQQWREERLKAQLILHNSEWRELLLTAERHRYFRGQIEFLLDFSGVRSRWLEEETCGWSKDEDKEYLTAFRSQYEKAIAIFDEQGLRQFDDFVWERALLAFGDYLLPNGRNLSLLDDRDRNASWKRLLRGADKTGDPLQFKRELVRQALDAVDPENVQRSLEKVIEDYLKKTDADKSSWWCKLFVECPQALAYCGQRFIRMTEGEGIFLLTRKKTSAYHVELRTYHLAKVLLPRMLESGRISAFKSAGYEAVCYESSSPHALLLADKIDLKLSVYFKSGQFLVLINVGDNAPANTIERLSDQQAFIISAENTSRMGKCVPVDALESELEGVSDCLCSLNPEG